MSALTKILGPVCAASSFGFVPGEVSQTMNLAAAPINNTPNSSPKPERDFGMQ